MRRTRFMSVLFLVLSASFFAMPQFRQAFTLPLLLSAYDWNKPGPPPMTAIPESVKATWKQEAEAGHDARMLAFLAIHTPDATEAGRLADLATAADPKLTWVYYELFNSNRRHQPPQVQDWIRKLQQFDPDNALGYLAEAELERENNKVLQVASNPMKPDYAERLQQKVWADAMAKAFAAPKYDTFNIRRFDLERTILHAKGYDTPVRMMFYVASYPISNLLNIRQYASLRVNYVGKNAEQAGKTKEALEEYWTVAHFGERMQIGSTNLIEQLIANAIQQIAYKPLSALLHSSGDTNAAIAVDNAIAMQNIRVDAIRGKDNLSLSSSFVWNAIMVNVFLGLVVIFSALTLVSILYVNVKQWWRAHRKGAIYGGITIAENYFPILLFIFCSALYISYYPYARNFSYYMTATGDMHNLEAMFYNTISLPMVLPRFMTLSVGNPFVPYAWYALGAIAIVVAASFIIPERKPVTEPKTMAAGASDSK